jgi:predicted lactoylglutathione lyase
MSLFISCPVDDVERAAAFYDALGWARNPDMSGPEAVCFSIAPDQYVMLVGRAMYASVGGTEDLVGGPGTPSKVTVSFDLDSQEAVDALVERATAAGGGGGGAAPPPRRHRRPPLHVPAAVRRPRRVPLVAVLDEAGAGRLRLSMSTAGVPGRHPPQ